MTQYWQVVMVAGEVPNLGKVPRRSIAAYLSMYIAYISVSIPTQWEVAGPYWQLASELFYDLPTSFCSSASSKRSASSPSLLSAKNYIYYDQTAI